MPWFKNEKPSLLGLAHKADGGPARTVQPGEVFEATADEIPEAWKKAGYIVDAKEPPKKAEPPPAQAVPDVASEEAPSDKEVADADAAREKASPSGFFGGKKVK
jgi:hypothetical protein